MRASVLALAVMVLAAGCGARAIRPRSTARIERTGRVTPAAVTSTTPEPPTEPHVDAPATWWSPYEALQARSSQEGRASYYADSLAGRPTASGEPYAPEERTAASRTLPFGTIVRVVRLETGASVIVRVNDRGPFGDRDRIIDLSRSAAEALGMLRVGVTRVRVEVLSE